MILPVLGWLKNWKGDGIIARIETEEIARAVKRTGLPVVDPLRHGAADLVRVLGLKTRRRQALPSGS